MNKTQTTDIHDVPDVHAGYRSPLETRNASIEMRAVFSARHKFGYWRRIWLALAESQRELGLPIESAQIDGMRAALDDIDFEAAAKHEGRLRHDVMAHVHTFGDRVPEAAGIIHLGATSQDVVCNADILIQRDALDLVAGKIARVIDRFGTFATRYRSLATLGFTHYQPAQPTTVGKRATLWGQDLVISLQEIERLRDGLRLRGMRGATGTQASFLGLFDRDADKVDALERLVAARLEWPPDRTWRVSGQTYPRLADAQLLNGLAVAAAAIHKCCNDLRLLANLKEVEEPFETNQIGSSAMAYKRNPMRCERATGLSRFVINLVGNGLDTAATQWFERTLDDSSNRRLSIPEAFLALDGALDIMENVAGGLIVNDRVVDAHLAAELPFMATEDLMLEASRRGGDRQRLHEVIRAASMKAAHRIKSEGAENDLLDRLKSTPEFEGIPIDDLMDPARFIGRAPEQVDAFVTSEVDPIRARYAGNLHSKADLRV
jgi:adenylosuccinate lyase